MASRAQRTKVTEISFKCRIEDFDPRPPRQKNMLIRASVVALFMILTFATGALAEPKLTGAWHFSQQKGGFGGTIQLNQLGPTFNGIWHTDKGEAEKDSTVYGDVKGSRVILEIGGFLWIVLGPAVIVVFALFVEYMHAKTSGWQILSSRSIFVALVVRPPGITTS
jgi:hypothetical protein